MGSRARGLPQPQCRSSVVVAHGLSCSGACGIFLNQGLNPDFCVDRQILIYWATGELQWWKHFCLSFKMRLVNGETEAENELAMSRMTKNRKVWDK